MSSGSNKDPEAGRLGESQPLVGNGGKDGGVASKATIWQDALDTITLGIPIFISMVSYVGVRVLKHFELCRKIFRSITVINTSANFLLFVFVIIKHIR